MLSVLLFIFLWCAFAVFVWRNRTHESQAHKLPPIYRGGLPIIGHAHHLTGKLSSFWPKTQALAQACIDQGGLIHVKVGSEIFYFISDPDDVLTAANACLEKHYTYNFTKPCLGNGLVTSPVETWKRHRKLLLPAFSLPVVHSFMGIFNDQARKLVRKVENHIAEGQFDHVEVLRSIALETFCMTAFGVNGVEDADYVRKYMLAVDDIARHIMVRLQKPWLFSDFLYQLLGYKRKEVKLVKAVIQMSDEIIQRKKKAISDAKNKNYKAATNSIKYKPFLDLLLDLSSDGSMTDREIGEELDTAIFAGFDTTSNALVSVLVMLGAYPEVQQRVYDEIVQTVGTERDIEKDDIKKLEYLEAVLMETMRMFPTGPMLPRAVTTDVKLKNYTLRAGTSCVLFPAGMHVDYCWGDRFQFRPERWLEPESVPRNSFAGFSVGKRNCIGKTYAMIAMKISMVHFLRRYKIIAFEENLQFTLLIMLKAKGTIAIENRIQ